MLEIKNFTKRYGKGAPAVDGLTLTVNGGEIYGFIGHNGAGKSTTIKAVVGALGFEDGDIFIDGSRLKPILLLVNKLLLTYPITPIFTIILRVYNILTSSAIFFRSVTSVTNALKNTLATLRLKKT